MKKVIENDEIDSDIPSLESESESDGESIPELVSDSEDEGFIQVIF